MKCLSIMSIFFSCKSFLCFSFEAEKANHHPNWENTYNRLERGLAWLAVFMGALFLIGFASVEFVNQLYADNTTPAIIKVGTVSLVFGLLVLLFSVIREKLFTYKNDKYKEIQR